MGCVGEVSLLRTEIPTYPCTNLQSSANPTARVDELTAAGVIHSERR
jgi:hypothetical protein